VLRKILAVLTALILSGLVVAIVEMVGMEIFPPADGFDPEAPDLALVPTMAMVTVGLAWFLGPLTGGLTATRIAQASNPSLAIIVGGLFLLADIANLLMIESPTWLWAVGIVAPVLGAYLGYRLGRADPDAQIVE